ncbi:hypothetical protein [Methylovulum miyakonense]|uniref:hypothetical protein n=1 Tax=Methylovulum miyakonense TaxID=645578 RepID=UPI0005903B14|nr:hypothetical protein [Methylovulum miyakonense]
MGIKHAANRFLRTPVNALASSLLVSNLTAGDMLGDSTVVGDLTSSSDLFGHVSGESSITGTSWVEITKGALLANDRTLSGSDVSGKLRTLLTDPAKPIPDSVSVIKFDDDIYLVGSSNTDRSENPYSISTLVRRAYFTCSIIGLSFGFAASGVKINPTREVKATTYCDKEPAAVDSSGEVPATEFVDEIIIMPKGVSIDTSYELHIQDNTSDLIYDIQEVWQYFGMTYCRGICRRTAINPL